MAKTGQKKRDIERAIRAHNHMIAERIAQKALAMFVREDAAQEKRIRGCRYDVSRHEWRVK